MIVCMLDGSGKCFLFDRLIKLRMGLRLEFILSFSVSVPLSLFFCFVLNVCFFSVCVHA